MQTININAVPDGFPQVLYYSQGDIGRQFIINVTDFTIPSGATVKIQATKPSGLGFSVAGTVSSNAVTFTTTADMTDEAGRYPAELQITSGGNVIGTANFTMNGEPNPHPDGTTDGQIGTIIPELTLLVEEIRNSNAKVESMTASAVPLASDSDPTASYDAEDNNLEFGIPVPEVTESEFLKAFIVESASGSIASFTDGADDVPVKSLKVNIEPKQSGSGDPSPSNVRPISGWDEVGVVRCGKNWLDESIIVNGDWDHIDSSYTGNVVTNGFIKIKGGATYTWTTPVMAGRYVRFYDENKTWLQSETVVFYNAYPSNTFTAPQTACYARFLWYSTTEITPSSVVGQTQLEVGSTATTYEPYQAETKSISLPSTVYGGTLDVVSGVLTVDRKKLTIDGTNVRVTHSYGSDAQRLIGVNISSEPAIGATIGNLLADNLKPSANILTDENAIALGDGNTKIIPHLPNMQGIGGTYANNTELANAINTALAQNPTTVVYKLANPTTVQLTPTEVKSLLGNNNIWSDAGTVEMEYRADTTLAYNKLLEAIANL